MDPGNLEMSIKVYFIESRSIILGGGVGVSVKKWRCAGRGWGREFKQCQCKLLFVCQYKTKLQGMEYYNALIDYLNLYSEYYVRTFTTFAQITHTHIYICIYIYIYDRLKLVHIIPHLFLPTSIMSMGLTLIIKYLIAISPEYFMATSYQFYREILNSI